MADPSRILVVCTANICRSVIAERLLRRELERRRLDEIEVASCGFLFDGEPASDAVLSVLADRGIDATDHRSRIFTPTMIDDADLVVTMERRHARELAMAAEGSGPRVHTLGALVTWLREAEELDGPPEARVRRFAEARNPADLLGSCRDEVDDPHGRSRRVHRRTAAQLEDLCSGLLDGLLGADASG